MSWRLGKKKASGLAAADDGASMRSITPTPGDDRHALPRTGILSIRVINAEGLAVPQGATLSAAVQAALKSQQAQVAASMSPSSVAQDRLSAVGTGHAKRNSVQRAQCWWLPYLVMEFEVNQVLITSHGSKLGNLLHMYEMHL